MYTPAINRVDERAFLLELMRANPFALLTGPAGGLKIALQATHLPLVALDEGPHGVLEGHFARANRHWESLQGHEALVVFTGPHAYISPRHYEREQAVPTWNYLAVHAYGQVQVVEDPAGKEAILARLLEANEPLALENWRAAESSYREAMLAGIVGFRMEIARIEGKVKLSQNRSAAERKNIHRAQQTGSEDEQALAGWMERSGLV